MLGLAVICAVLPAFLLAVYFLFGLDDSASFEQDVVEGVTEPLNNQLRLNLEAHAERINWRLNRVADSVLLLSTYAEHVLGAPEVYGEYAELVPPTEGEEIISQSDSAGPLFDNPIYYSTDSPALYKVIDDGGTAVFFRSPEGSFTHNDRVRLYATAALEEPLKALADLDPICSQAYIVSYDSMLRTYPFRNFNSWPADKDLTKLAMYAYSPHKASERGLVWTSPYVSHLTDDWVVACLTNVEVGGRLVAVVGAELSLKELASELLTFSLGSGGTCWMYRRDGIVLASQDGGSSLLGIQPMDTAPIPEETQDSGEMKEAANLFTNGHEDIANILRSSDSTEENEIPRVKVATPIDEDRFLYATPVFGPNWILGGVVESPAVTALREYQIQVESSSVRKLIAVAVTLVVGLLTAFLLTTFESRRIVNPLSILTQQVRQAQASKMMSSVKIPDEGELGSLANAIQDLVDYCKLKEQHGQIQHGDVPADDAGQDPADPDGLWNTGRGGNKAPLFDLLEDPDTVRDQESIVEGIEPETMDPGFDQETATDDDPENKPEPSGD